MDQDNQLLQSANLLINQSTYYIIKAHEITITATSDERFVSGPDHDYEKPLCSPQDKHDWMDAIRNCNHRN